MTGWRWRRVNGGGQRLIESVADARLELREAMTAEQLGKEEEFAGGARVAGARGVAEREKAERELDVHMIAARGAAVSAFAKAQYAGALGVEAIRREVLGNGRALVEYVLGESKSYVFVLSSGGLVSAELPGRAEIETQVAAYRRELSERVTGLTVAGAMGRYSAASRRMYALLVGPVEKALAGSRELVVVPDGVLAYVPFDVNGDGAAGGEVCCGVCAVGIGVGGVAGAGGGGCWGDFDGVGGIRRMGRRRGWPSGARGWRRCQIQGGRWRRSGRCWGRGAGGVA